MKLKKFNEDIDGEFESDSPVDNDVFQSEIFREIDADIESMIGENGQAEAIDYLMSIITYCNQQIKSIGS